MVFKSEIPGPKNDENDGKGYAAFCHHGQGRNCNENEKEVLQIL